jgi:hyaluronoglucosaminidase
MIYWTGADVNSPITQSTVDYVTNKCGQPVAYWLNYPVNEHAKSGVYLGNIDHYARDGVTGLRAAVSNPSRFGYSNKVALFQLAALFWNNSNYSEH